MKAKDNVVLMQVLGIHMLGLGVDACDKWC